MEGPQPSVNHNEVNIILVKPWNVRHGILDSLGDCFAEGMYGGKRSNGNLCLDT